MVKPKIVPRISVEKMFFDRAHVIARIGRENAKALSKAGAYIRQRAKTKILRRRKTTSSPGQAPSVHAKTGAYASLKNIDFYLDKTYEELQVGPIKIHRSPRPDLNMNGQTAPQVLEHSGTIGFRESLISTGKNQTVWVSRRRKTRRTVLQQRTRNVKILKRPFMSTALDQEIKAGLIGKMWYRSVESVER